MMYTGPYAQIAARNGIRPVLGRNSRLTTAGRWWKVWLRAWSVIGRVHCPHRTAVVESGDWMRWECSCGAHGSACPIRGKDGRPAVDADVTRFLAYIGGLQHARAAARLGGATNRDAENESPAEREHALRQRPGGARGSVDRSVTDAEVIRKPEPGVREKLAEVALGILGQGGDAGR